VSGYHLAVAAVVFIIICGLAGLAAIIIGAAIGEAALDRQAARRSRASWEETADHVNRTRPLDLGGLVIHSEMERCAWRGDWGAETRDDLTEAIDPDPGLGCPCCPGARSNDCTCRRPCGDPSCQAIDPAEGCTWCVVIGWEWPCTCDGACGDPACAPAVRHG